MLFVFNFVLSFFFSCVGNFRWICSLKSKVYNIRFLYSLCPAFGSVGFVRCALELNSVGFGTLYEGGACDIFFVRVFFLSVFCILDSGGVADGREAESSWAV